jgi:hypothetical protein
MARIPNYRRLSAEDYEQEYQALVEKIGYVINDHMRNVTDLVNGTIDFDNLAFDSLPFSLTVDSNGTPVGNNQVNVGRTGVTGLQVIRALPSNGTSFATSQPFISFTDLGNNLIRIDRVTGLQANVQYTMRMIVY